MQRVFISWVLGLCFGLWSFGFGPSPAAAQCPECNQPLTQQVQDLVTSLRTAHPGLATSQLTPAVEAALTSMWASARERTIEPCPSVPSSGGRPQSPTGHTPAVGDPPVLDTLATFVQVFDDANEDGVFDAGESGIPNIQVSNGTANGALGPGSTRTDSTGSHTFVTRSWDSRFVFVTVPSGYRATTPFYRRISAASPDTAYFGLVSDPSTADPIFRWVQMSDPQVANLAEEGLQHGDDVAEVENLATPPEFIVITGDLVQTGGVDLQFSNYTSGLTGASVEIHHGFGDHDGNPGCLQVENFEDLVDRPTSYSFERGGIHFIMYNDIFAADVEGCFTQEGWFLADVIEARARVFPDPLPVIICKHTLPGQPELDLYSLISSPEHGEVMGVFSGHWHGSRVRDVQGIFDVNTPPSRFGGIDKSSRGFRIVDMSPSGIVTEFREAGLVEHLRITHPAANDTVLNRPQVIRVSAFTTAADEQSAEFWLDGPFGTTPVTALTQESPWGWAADWDATPEAEGLYTLHARVIPDAGAAYEDSVSFHLVRGTYIDNASTYTDWPSYKLNTEGTGHSTAELLPPLRLEWARYMGSPTNIASPTVAADRVYLGTSNTSTTSEAKIYCLDTVTGAVLWEESAHNDVKSTPTVADGNVYFTNSTGTVFARDALDGELVWSTQLGDSLDRWEMTSPAVVGGEVYVGGAAMMAALDGANGAILWDYSVAGSRPDFIPSTYTKPAVKDEVVIFSGNRGLHAFDRTDGTLLWTSGGNVCRSVAIADSVAYTAGTVFGAQQVRGFHYLTGAEVYTAATTLYESTSSPIAAPDGLGGHRIVAAHAGNQLGTTGAPIHGGLRAFVPPGTTADWSYSLSSMITTSAPYKRDVGSVQSTPACSAGLIYFGGDDGQLHCLDAENGFPIWTYDLGVPLRSSPAIAGNMLFIAGSDGTLYAFSSTYIETAGISANGSPGLTTRWIGATPNPFNPATTLRFELSEADARDHRARFDIYDAAGRHVRTLVSGKLDPGLHSVTWDGRTSSGSRAASAVYFGKLRVGERSFQQKLVLTK